MSALDAARTYLELGWRPLPVQPRGKKPWLDGRTLEGWERLQLNAADLPRYFPAAVNVGCALGAASAHLVDVDLDCAEAVELAPLLLPSTWTFGRTGKPRSHWLYVAVDAKTERFTAPAGGGVLLELRGAGAQTVFPGSTHASGETIDWTEDVDAQETPTAISAGALHARCAKLAATALVLRFAGRAAVTAWMGGGTCPALPDEAATAVRRWWRLDAPRTSVPRPATGDVVDRARRYLARVPGAVSGSGGHVQTLLAAEHLVRGFELDDVLALELLVADFNPRCAPPWSQRELEHKVRQARERGTGIALGQHLGGRP